MSIRFMILVTTLLASMGCATTKRPALPHEQDILGALTGYDEHIRFWGDEYNEYSEERAHTLKRQVARHDETEFTKPQSYLAISGGGQNGAFGAGLLNGWTAHGSRPDFRVVTGISTGAIIAPFAFMGPAYDSRLKEMYTQYSTKQIIRARPMRGIFGGNALTDSTPLLELIRRHVDDGMIEGIAEEHRKGRMLFIATTYLDAKRPVIWDLGAIASSASPGKAGLIHHVILASASIPGAFPPVFIDVTKDGLLYNEMHVDGGISNQLFITPTELSIRESMSRSGFTGGGTVYVIRNSTIATGWESIRPNTSSISTASIGGLTMNQGNTDQYVVYLQSKLDAMDFRAAQIPADFRMESHEPFDPEYMTALYNHAYGMAINGYPWSTSPKSR